MSDFIIGALTVAVCLVLILALWSMIDPELRIAARIKGRIKGLDRHLERARGKPGRLHR